MANDPGTGAAAAEPQRPAESAPPPGVSPPGHKPRDPVRTWTIVIAALIAVIFIYSMIADRLTPFSSDAHVQAFIVRISPEVSGRVTGINVVENQFVPAGTTLFTIDPEPFRIAVGRAEAGLAAAGQQVGASTASVNTAQAHLTAAMAKRDNLRIEAERIAELVADGVYTQARGDQAATTLAEAEAAVVAAQSEVERARQQLGPEGESPQLQQAMEDLQAAQLNLAHTTIVAPSEGVVTNLQLDDGQFTAAGQPAMTFIDARLVWIVANMRENNLEHLKAGDCAEVVLDLLPGRVFPAKVGSIGWGVAGGSVDQRTGLPDVKVSSEWLQPAQRFPVRLEFINGEFPHGARYNARAAVVVYTGDNPLVNALASLWIRAVSFATYVYDPAPDLVKWLVLRLAVAVGVGLTLTTISGVAIPGLAPVLALQMLLAPALPGYRQGVFLSALVLVVTVVIYGLAMAFGDRPQFLMLFLALLYAIGFLMQPRAPVPALLFLITVALVPVWMAQTGPGGTLYQTVAIAVPLSLLIAWAIDAMISGSKPKLPSPTPTPPRPLVELAPATALLKGLIILPVQLFYIQSPSAFSMAGIVTLIVILNLPTRAATLRILAARILGNIIGGLAALAAFTLIYAEWSTLMLLLTALFGATLLARWLLRAGGQSAVASLALVNFTLLLGIAVSQQIGGEPVDLAQRIIDISIIATYGVCASSLLRKGYAPAPA